MSISIHRHFAVTACVLTAALAASIQPANAQLRSAQTMRAEQSADIPVCARPLGTLAVIEPEGGENWWTGQQLPAPSALIKVFVSKSNCFTLVARDDRTMGAMQAERELAASGEHRRGSNVGRGQMRAADYVMTPDLIGRNNNAAGGGIGAAIGGLMGGRAGSLVSGVNFRRKTADVVLSVTDIRSSEQVAMAEGHAKKNDIGFSGSGALFGSSGLGGAGVGGYSNTEVGQVITLAYLDAYKQIVGQLGGVPSNASAANAQQSVTVTRTTTMTANAGGGRTVREVDPGMTLYPTGNKQGAMWEVEDEMGNKGWVSSTMMQMSR